ncbi:hypothetical protein B0H14DRAFT_318120 [Mycena olivaceomarginata]|nr:hypothetical protein B0H14DRAFT_318120 [Mycena olivaceomarginata]
MPCTVSRYISLYSLVSVRDCRLRKLGALGEPAMALQPKDSYRLHSWVLESGRVQALGKAAHPCPPSRLHPYSIALEDAAFIGKIFSHSLDRNRVSEFLYAFQEHREPRCSRVRDIDMQYVQATTIPAGDMHDQRDVEMRVNYAAGRNALDSNLSQILEFRTVVICSQWTMRTNGGSTAVGFAVLRGPPLPSISPRRQFQRSRAVSTMML